MKSRNAATLALLFALTSPLANADQKKESEGIQQIYQTVLGRSADETGLKFWLKQYSEGHLNLEEIRSAFAKSDESREKIINSYLLTKGRAPSAKEMTEAVEQLSTKISLAELKRSLGPADREKIIAQLTSLYAKILRREPDQEGLKFWTEQVCSGTFALSQVRPAFAASPEATKIITNLYKLKMNRGPSKSELDAAVSRLSKDDGATMEQIAASL